jgi:hypothetical protein
MHDLERLVLDFHAEEDAFDGGSMVYLMYDTQVRPSNMYIRT